MATTAPPTPTLEDLLEQLGGIPPSRVLLRPAPGQATEADVIEIQEREDRLCELVDGVLVEKPTGYRESILAVAIGAILRAYVIPRNLGLVSGTDGMMRLFPGLVRIPDVAFASWDRFPNRRVPTEPIPDLAPDLAIEVLSQSNTAAETARKRREYFAAGVRLVWLVDPATRRAMIYRADGTVETLDESQPLDGGDVLPGFALPLRDLFGELDRQG
jgi:Uma2 family endonuclease